MKSISEIIRFNVITEIFRSKFSKTPVDSQLCIQALALNAKPEIDRCNLNANLLELPNITIIDRYYSNLSDFMENLKQNSFYINDWDTVRSELVELVQIIAKDKKIHWKPEKINDFLQKQCKVIHKAKKA